MKAAEFIKLFTKEVSTALQEGNCLPRSIEISFSINGEGEVCYPCETSVATIKIIV